MTDKDKQRDTVIELHKESYKKTLDVYYLNQASLDKLIMTILFAEIGFLINAIKTFELYFLPVLIFGAIGLVFTMLSYRCSGELLSNEKLRITLDIFYTIGFTTEYEDDYNRMDEKRILYGNKLDFYNIMVYTMLFYTTVYCFISFYILKQSCNFKLNTELYYWCVGISSALLVIFSICKYEKLMYQKEFRNAKK